MIVSSKLGLKRSSLLAASSCLVILSSGSVFAKDKYLTLSQYQRYQSIASIPPSLIRSFQREVQEFFARTPRMLSNKVPGLILGKTKALLEHRAQAKIAGMEKGVKKALLEFYVDSRLRGGIRFISGAFGLPPETLNLMYILGDMCALEPDICRDAAIRQAAIYSQKQAQNVRSSKEYKMRCYPTSPLYEPGSQICALVNQLAGLKLS